MRKGVIVVTILKLIYVIKIIMETQKVQSESVESIEKIIINKKKLKVIKNERNNYSILYNLTNNFIYLSKIR